MDAQTGRPLFKAVEEFLIHGVKYAFPVQRGETTRGVPTAYAAPPLSGQIVANGDLPPIWPDPDGEVDEIDEEPVSARRMAERLMGSRADPPRPTGLDHEDAERLKATLVELLELKRVLDQAR